MDQSIATATNVPLAFNTERYDTNGFHDVSTNNTRLTVPSGMAGAYLIHATVNWTANTDATSRILQLRVNGATYIAIDARPAIATAAQPTRHTIGTVYYLAVGDYVELVAHQLAARVDHHQCTWQLQPRVRHAGHRVGGTVNESTMQADLTARLATLERQHADQLALFRAGMAIGQTEGRIAELRAILTGFDQAEAEAEADAAPGDHDRLQRVG